MKSKKNGRQCDEKELQLFPIFQKKIIKQHFPWHGQMEHLF